MMLAGFLFLLLVQGGSSSSNPVEATLHEQHEERNLEPLTEGAWDSRRSSSSNSEAALPGLPDRGLTGGAWDYRSKPKSTCKHQDIFDHLKYKTYNEHYSMTRPGSAEEPLNVTLDVLLYAILDVNEKEQKFVSYIWIDMWWNLDVLWNPVDFCGVEVIYHPTNLLWIPDVTIEELMEKDEFVPSPYLTVGHNGFILTRNTMMVVSTCKMNIYKFPFDVQSCNFSFKSAILQADDLELLQAENPHWNMEWSRKMLFDGEWQLINMTINKKTVDNFGIEQSMLVYTIIIQRHSALYAANFLLPIFFFLCLDLASFLIPDSSEEKLSFKVTVLLAVTVMQLILNEILPSSSDSLPLIAVYCIGSFGLMMCSLLETILVKYLMEKDYKFQDNKGSSSQLMEKSHDFEKLSDELNGTAKTLSLLHGTRNEEMEPGYWITVAKTINKAFFLFYGTFVSLFLGYLFMKWTTEEK